MRKYLEIVCVSLVVVLMCVLGGMACVRLVSMGYEYYASNIEENAAIYENSSDVIETTVNDGVVKIAIDEWIGWSHLLDANGGMVTAPESLNAQQGISVEVYSE